MTELIINGTRAVLPRDINFTMLEENPLFTKNGEFSLDITLSLMNPVNAKIFKHINRLNVADVVSEADAILIADNKLTKGKIVEVKNTDTDVSFQFVARNSELNFLARNDKKIWQLDFGIEDAVDYERALFSIQHPGYGEVIENDEVIGFNKFVCVPVKFANMIANDYTIQPQIYNVQEAEIDGVNNIVIQPYWMHYISTLPELLGFEVVENVLLEDELAKELFIPNTVKSLRYSDALPDLTVSEFIDVVEEFFNVFFFVTKDRKCLILNRDSYIGNRSVLKLKNVLDSYDRESESVDVDTSSISYDLGSDGYLKYQKLKKEVVDISTVSQYANRLAMKNAITLDMLNKFILHKTTNNGFEYVFTPSPQLNIYRVGIPFTGNSCIYVNKFKDSSQSENPKVLTVKPLPFTYIEKTAITQVKFPGMDPENVYWTLPYQLPFINSNLYIQNDQFLLNAIESSLEKIPRRNKIEIGIYSGMINFYPNEVSYPYSYLDNHPEHWMIQSDIDSVESPTFEGYFNEWITNVYKPVCSKTLRLTGSDGLYNRYHVRTQIDTTIVYIFRVLDKNLTTNNLYEYNGSIYIPFSIEKTVDINGESEIKTAKFYKLK